MKLYKAIHRKFSKEYRKNQFSKEYIKIAYQLHRLIPNDSYSLTS